MTVLQVQSLPVLANQHRQISFFHVIVKKLVLESSLGPFHLSPNIEPSVR